MSNRLCPKCGKELSENARICGACGANLDAPANDPPPQTAPRANAPRANEPQTNASRANAPQPAAQRPASRPAWRSKVKPKPCWGLIAGLAVAGIIIIVAVLFLTGVLKLGGAAIAPEELNGNWTGTIKFDLVAGTGENANNLRSRTGESHPFALTLALGENGKGTAAIDSATIPAELNGSTLKLSGQLNSSATFDYIGEISKADGRYVMTGDYTIAYSGMTLQGKLTLTLSTANSNALLPSPAE